MARRRSARAQAIGQVDRGARGTALLSGNGCARGRDERMCVVGRAECRDGYPFSGFCHHHRRGRCSAYSTNIKILELIF